MLQRSWQAQRQLLRHEQQAALACWLPFKQSAAAPRGRPCLAAGQRRNELAALHSTAVVASAARSSKPAGCSMAVEIGRAHV